MKSKTPVCLFCGKNFKVSRFNPDVRQALCEGNKITSILITCRTCGRRSIIAESKGGKVRETRARILAAECIPYQGAIHLISTDEGLKRKPIRHD